MRARPLLSAVGAIALGMAGAVLDVGGSPAAYAAAAIACNSIPTPSSSTGTTLDGRLPNDPFVQMRIAEAQGALRSGTTPGQGVTVAVVDTGISPTGIAAPVKALTSETHVTPATYFHGTTVAGLIAGAAHGDSKGGVAPGVTLLDLPVMKMSSDSQSATPDWGAVSQALKYLLTRPRGERLIVNMSFDTHTNRPEIETAVKQLIARGAIVVAAGGNRTNEDATSTASPSPYVGTENRDTDIFPADYPGVVAVGAANTAGVSSGDGDPDPTGAVFANSAIDVAAPTEGARSWTLNGKPCIVTDVATSWSTAIVTGTLAMVWSAYPHDTRAAIVDRLERTASGRTDERGHFTGAGIIQPYDAVTRPLGPPETFEPTTVRPAHVAPPEADALEGIRHDAQWWGLLGGGALILALILRPLLSRRR